MHKPKKVFYGWWIVIAITTMSFTGGAAPFAIVLKQLMEQFHTGRGGVSLGPSIGGIAFGVAGIIAGKLLQRFKPKTFMLWGTVVAGLSTLLLSLSNNLGYFYTFSFIGGVAGGFGGVIASFTLLSKWFNRKWGTALGITMAGSAIGSMVLRPLVGLIAENVGWQATYLLAGSLTLVVNLPLILFVLKDSPESRGLLPDGDKYKEIVNTTIVKPAAETKSAPITTNNKTGIMSYLKSPALWLLGISFACVAIGDSAVTNHEVSFITDMGISATVAASAFGFTLGISGVSRLGSGWLADRLSSRYVAILFLIVEIAGMLILMQANTMSRVWMFVIVFGLGTGAATTLLPIVTRDIFGGKDFSVLFGFTNVLFVVGGAIGTPLAGFMFDAMGSYYGVFIVVAIIYAISILSIYFAFGASPRTLLKRSVKI
jgi:sugar phosphate permease